MSALLKISLLAIFMLIIIAGGVYWFVFEAVDVDMKPVMNNQEIAFDEIGEKIYARAMAWGVAGNHNEIILSTEPITPRDRKSETGRDFIFYTTELYHKKQGADTLLVYVESSSIGEIPDNTSSKINIVPMRLETFDESRDYEKNYKERGLSKISVYREQSE